MKEDKKQKELYELSKKWLHSPANALDIDALKEVLRYHEWRYSIKNDPVIADYEYDTLYKQLEQIELYHKQLITKDSPTQRVSSDLSESDLSEDFPTIEHTVPMLSLDNSYNDVDLRKFDEQIRKLANLTENEPIAYCLEPKYDGGSVALVYEDDQYVRAATRGNGQRGEDITLNVKTLSSVPLNARFSKREILKLKYVEKRLSEKTNSYN